VRTIAFRARRTTPSATFARRRLALFRIAQEAMGNAVTHGAARHVDVHLTRSNGLVVLTVTDDGRVPIQSHRWRAGLGLINMRDGASVARHVRID
jgi:signal transduction histidine kinase